MKQKTASFMKSFLPLLPWPKHVTSGSERVLLAPEMGIVADEMFTATAELLASRLRKSTGWAWPVTKDGSTTPGLEFRHSAPSPEKEAYSLSVQPDRIVILAGDTGGAWYGAQTFLQLLPAAIFGEAALKDPNWSLPTVEISDAPRFRWRGIMLDSARHFQPVAYLKKLIDVFSQHKINVFHWHLTDDQGWRLEIKKYPRLASVGGRRRETKLGHLVSTAAGDGVPHEGFYTQDEVRELVAYAQARNVTIVPEIDMPGHAQAAVAAYPELGCMETPPEVSTTWGIHETLFNVQPTTITFLHDVLEEVLALFPSEYIHIGGDEAVKKQWINDAATQLRMRELDLPDEHRLQSWFISQMGEFLQSRGRKLIGWDEILEGGLPASATVMSWRDEEGAIAAASKGHDAVMSTQNAYYFDYCQSESKMDEPLHIGGLTTLRKTYEFAPVPEQLSAREKSSIIGVQGQIWTEYIATPSRLEYMTFPRICALAEAGWSQREPLDYEGFKRRLLVHLKRLDCQDIRYRPPFDELA